MTNTVDDVPAGAVNGAGADDSPPAGTLGRRLVLGAGLAGALTPLLPPAATAAAAPGTTVRVWKATAVRTPLIDPRHEMAPPALGALTDVGAAPAGELRTMGGEVSASSLPGDRTTAALPAGLPFSFRYDDFAVQDLRDGVRPYYLGSPLPLKDSGVHDSSGVRMAMQGGRLQDHPVAQAQYGINLLESFRVTGNREYLARAEKQAQRLVDRRVAHRGGWFYPYPFRYALHRAYDIYNPPWYSMMAQGQALTLFCRLHRVTKKGAWRTAADATFNSYLVPPVAGRPWGVYVVNGLLWLEEYPNPRQVRGDRTYNGHTFSAYGLWDYWVLTKNEKALALLRGALTTTRDVHGQVRNRHWRSKYCLRHSRDAAGYHGTHIGQHLQVHAITGDTIFARIAELYYTDYPAGPPRGTVIFAPGTHTGYRFDAQGRAIARKSITLTRRSNAPSVDRGKVLNQTGIWYTVSAGSLAGYQVREVPGRCYVLGMCGQYRYRTPRPIRMARDRVRVYSLSSSGAVGSAVSSYRAGDREDVDARAVLNGVEHLKLVSGPYAGKWIRYADAIRP